MLYHEATFDKTKGDLALMTGHSTTFDAAKTAFNAKVKALIIGHFSARYKNIGQLVEEARTIFPETYPAIDGQTLEVGNISAKE
jgi:ribonuclease Z